MKTVPHSPARKYPVNLTLNEDLVRRVRPLSNNLSELVESLLPEFVERELQRRRAQSLWIETTVALWNGFEETHGSFADKYSTL